MGGWKKFLGSNIAKGALANLRASQSIHCVRINSCWLWLLTRDNSKEGAIVNVSRAMVGQLPCCLIPKMLLPVAAREPKEGFKL